MGEENARMSRQRRRMRRHKGWTQGLNAGTGGEDSDRQRNARDATMPRCNAKGKTCVLKLDVNWMRTGCKDWIRGGTHENRRLKMHS